MVAKTAFRVVVRALVFMPALVVSHTFAQGVLTASDQIAQADALYTSGASTFGNSGLTRDQAGVDFHATQDRRHVAASFDGRGFAEHGATFLPSNPGINGPFLGAILDACTSAEITRSAIGPHSYEEAYGLASGLIEFTIDTPHNWSWVGGWQGASFSTGAYNLVDAELSFSDINTGTPYVYDYRASLNGVGDWVQNFAYGGVIGPGNYRITWWHESYCAGGNTPFGFFASGAGGAPLISCINSTFQIWPVPAPGTAALLATAALALCRRRNSALPA
ncbi:MAG: hypothetical protein IT432_09440 [Phycisphaerales bacterium]|nr:hypothetical protein [Phycisphaerales bacterium]